MRNNIIRQLEHALSYSVTAGIEKLLTEKVGEAQKKDLRQSLITGDKVGMRFLDYLIQIMDILEKPGISKII